MVRIAIAGGSGGLASEVIDGLVATGKHQVLLLSRRDAPKDKLPAGVSWHKVDDYKREQLVEVLQGVDTVLSFITSHLDPGNLAQRNLADASIEAGVRRFAPSEWMTSRIDYMDWYANKAEFRKYLEEVNKDKKRIEYCLFQPGYFMDYLAAPHETMKHIETQHTFIDFDGCQALMIEGDDNARIAFTAVRDIVGAVVQAIDYPGEWPVVGGFRGQELSIAELLELGKRIRGRSFSVEKLSATDLKAGEFKVKGWSPKVHHPSILPEQLETISNTVTPAVMLGAGAGAFQVSDEWNRLLPHYEFTTVETLLTSVFKDKS